MTDGSVTADKLQKWFREYLSTHIECHPNEVSLDVPIRDLGLKSIDVLAIPGDLGDRFGFCIPDLAVWDNPSANDLIDSLLNQRSADSLRESWTRRQEHAGSGQHKRAGCGHRSGLSISGRY